MWNWVDGKALALFLKLFLVCFLCFSWNKHVDTSVTMVWGLSGSIKHILNYQPEYKYWFIQHTIQWTYLYLLFRGGLRLRLFWRFRFVSLQQLIFTLRRIIIRSRVGVASGWPLVDLNCRSDSRQIQWVSCHHHRWVRRGVNTLGEKKAPQDIIILWTIYCVYASPWYVIAHVIK